jgi:hypothetical protein
MRRGGRYCRDRPRSVNADYDNGIGLHHTTRRRRAHEHAAKRVEASVGEKYRPDLIPVGHQPGAQGGTKKKLAARV